MRAHTWPWLVALAVLAVGVGAWMTRSEWIRLSRAHAPLAAATRTSAAEVTPAPAASDPVAAIGPAAPSSVARSASARPPDGATAARTTGAPALAGAPPAAPGTAGRIVAIDPETGRPGAPSPEQVRALTGSEDAYVVQTAEGLREEHLPDGTVLLHLDGRFQNYSVARVGRDGRPVLGCVHDQEGSPVHGHDHAPVKAPPALEVE
jgi:hypothetical protein